MSIRDSATFSKLYFHVMHFQILYMRVYKPHLDFKVKNLE
jgi:hypothetical protein